MYVCLCRGVTVADVKEAIASGARSVERIRDVTGAGSGCGGCVSTLHTLLEAGAGVGPAVRRLAVLDDRAERPGAHAA